MRITYQGSGLMEIDGDTLAPGDSAEVSDARGTELTERFPGVIVPQKPAVSPAPSAPLAASPNPSAQSASGTASSDSTTGD